MFECNSIRVAVVFLAAVAAPLHGLPQGYPWEQQGGGHVGSTCQQCQQRRSQSYERVRPSSWDESSSTLQYLQGTPQKRRYRDSSDYASQFTVYAPHGHRLTHPRQHMQSYAAPAASYSTYSRPSRSGGTFGPSSSASNTYEDGDSFKRMDAVPVNSYGADGSFSSSPNAFNDEQAFHSGDGIPVKEYETTPRRQPKLYVVQHADERLPIETDRELFPISMPRPDSRHETKHSLTDRQLEDVVTKAIKAARYQQRREEALYRSVEASLAKNLEDNQEGSSAMENVHLPRKVFRASDVVYRPQITHNPYNLSPEMNIPKFLGLDPRVPEQEDFRLDSDVTIGEVQQAESNDEVPILVDSTDATSAEDDFITMEIPNVSSGEVIAAPVIRTQENVDDFNQRLNEGEDDEVLEGDVVLAETMEDAENVEDAVNMGASTAHKEVATEISESHEDPDMMDDVEDPPVYTEPTVAKEDEPSSTTPKN